MAIKNYYYLCLPSVKITNDLVSYSLFHISSNICILKKHHHFLHFTILSQFVTLDIVFLSAVPLLHWGQSCRQCFIVSIWFLHAAFLQVGGYSFLDIRGPWVSLVCPICILVLPTAIVCTFPFFDALLNRVQLTSAVFPFPLSFGVPSPPDGQVNTVVLLWLSLIYQAIRKSH